MGGMTKGLLGFIGGVWSYIQRPKVPPAKAARTPNVILNKVYKANIPQNPCFIRISPSLLKVEKVVNPPHRPVVSNSRTSVERLKRADKVQNSPMRKLPRILTVNVAHGKEQGTMRSWSIICTQQRSTLPVPPPRNIAISILSIGCIGMVFDCKGNHFLYARLYGKVCLLYLWHRNLLFAFYILHLEIWVGWRQPGKFRSSMVLFRLQRLRLMFLFKGNWLSCKRLPTNHHNFNLIASERISFLLIFAFGT